MLQSIMRQLDADNGVAAAQLPEGLVFHLKTVDEVSSRADRLSSDVSAKQTLVSSNIVHSLAIIGPSLGRRSGVLPLL